MVIFRNTRLFATLSQWTTQSYSGPEQLIRRGLRTRQLIYDQYGEPQDVVKCVEVEVPPLKDGQVLVRMIASPVNPADCNTIQGKYPVDITLPCIAGNEGVGTVLEVKGVNSVSPGNKVIVTKPLQGTWRTEAIYDGKLLKVVPDELGIVEAATLTVNPSTAYRMLTDFKPVREKGLVVIQNGANSACGQSVIQLCKAWNIPNVNIVRNRPEIDDLKKFLTELGATHVLTEEESRTTKLFKDKVLDKPTLALNCVGGKSALEMLRHLKHSGSMVTYGGMSREPVTVPTTAFIFKNISCHGYWMSAWTENSDQAEKVKMWDALIKLMIEKKLKGPTHELVKLDNYKEALANALNVTGFTGKKYILDFC